MNAVVSCLSFNVGCAENLLRGNCPSVRRSGRESNRRSTTRARRVGGLPSPGRSRGTLTRGSARRGSLVSGVDGV